MPPFAEGLRESLRLPVYDVRHAVELVMRGAPIGGDRPAAVVDSISQS